MKLLDGTVYFTVSEVAKYFGRSTPWVHYGEKAGYWVHGNGDPIEIRRTPSGTRLFSADNIVHMAWALHDRNLFTVEQVKEVMKAMEKF